jgi:hypothetical protein
MTDELLGNWWVVSHKLLWREKHMPIAKLADHVKLRFRSAQNEALLRVEAYGNTVFWRLSDPLLLRGISHP